jgi:hypothetical protein
VFIDAYYCVRLLEPNGVILFDDSTYPHVAKLIRFLRRTLRDSMAPLDLAPFRMDRMRYRLAQAFGRAQLTAFQRVGNPERSYDAKFHNF